MATLIVDDCINCGACEPVCPNKAITAGEALYVINPERCTECVGFHDTEQCAAVCPVDACLPDPDREESERGQEEHEGCEVVHGGEIRSGL
jgi:ferredoxin